MANYGDRPINNSILLISPNFAPEPTGIGKVNGEMVAWLAKKGFVCDVITGFPYYPQWRVQPPYKNRWFKNEKLDVPESATISVSRVPFFIPHKPSGVKRLLQDLSYWLSVPWVVRKFLSGGKSYKLIISVAPPFHLAYLGLKIRRRTGGKLVYHIQDLQIEAAQELNIIPGKKLINFFYRMERTLLNQADFVSAISPNMIKKIRAKVDRELVYFPNWVDIDYFHPLKNRKALRKQWGFSDTDVIFLYSGAIGEKQGLENILHTAGSLITRLSVKFIICGSGPYTDRLMKMAEGMRLTNLSFLPVQQNGTFNAFLNMADYHLILQKGNASDLVMPSKLSTILAVGGVSIVTTLPGTSLYSLYRQNDIGYIVEPDDYKKLSKLISELKCGNEFEQKAENARQYAVDHLNIDSIMKKFLEKVLPQGAEK